LRSLTRASLLNFSPRRQLPALRGNAYTGKSSSRTNCPCTAHAASRILPDARVTLIHGAQRQIETQNKKQNPPGTRPPPRHPNPCPSLVTLLTSPKMTINLAPSRRTPLLSHNRSGSRKPCYSLIANARLKFHSSHRKLSPLKFPNRERMAILHPITKPPTTARHRLVPRKIRIRSAKQPRCCPRTKPGFLIVTRGLEFPLRPVKTIPSKFLIVTKRSFIPRPDASHSPRSFRAPNLNLGQRNDLRLKWHRHSCLCSDDYQPTTTTHHPRPHFTCTSTQPDPQLQSNFQEQPKTA
jgi:hypothetical protein